MSEYSWDNPKLQLICGQCHLKDKDPKLCHGVELPIEKTFIPESTSDCFFIRESYWQRIPEEQKEGFKEDIRERSERYYSRIKKKSE